MKTVKQKQKQTIVGLVISIICLLMFTTAMTFAYFTARNSAESTAMQFGTLEISVDNVGVSKEAEHELMPGCTVSLAGEVTLGDSTIDAFVRIKPEVNITAWNGTSLTEANAELQLSNLIIGAFEKEVNSTKTGDFIRATGDNTYLYYTGKFAHDATYDFGTHNIAFTIDANTFGNDWQGCTFTVKITAEAIQADHVGVTDSQITTGGQTLVDAIANAKANNETDSAWNGVSGNNQEEQNNALAEASLPYLDFTPVNSDGSEIDNATTLSDNVNEMPTLNGVNTQVSNLMADDGTMFVSVKSKSVNNNKTATGDIAIPSYIKVDSDSHSVVLATKAEWENNSAYKVIKIADNAFSGCTELTSITIPSSITSIGDGAFWECSGLTSITIPNSVISIGDYAFQSSGLTTITLPSTLTQIGDNAFEGCSSLASITIPEGVTSIGYGAFSGCTELTSITIPSSVTSIGDVAFSGCSSLASVAIPKGVTSIGDGAFGGCSGISSIVVDSGNTIYDSGDNSNAIIETSTNTLLVGCKNSTIPNTVTSIGDGAFWGCSGLTSITIPNGVITIGKSAFSGCTSLAIINIAVNSSGLTIGNNAFNYTITGGKTFRFTGSVVPTLSSNSSSLGSASNITKIYVPAGMKASYNTGNWVANYYAKIEESLA